MNILFLSPWFPFPPSNGSELRINNLLRGLVTEHHISLISFTRRTPSEADLRTAHEYCEQVHLIPWKEFNPRSQRARWGFLSRKPRSVVDTYSPEMADCIKQAIHAKPYDVIVASQLGTAAYSSIFNGTPALLDEVELGTYHQQAQIIAPAYLQARLKLTWAKQKAYVKSLIPHFKACTVVSEQEKKLLAAVAPKYNSVELIPNCIDLGAYEQVYTPREPLTLIFTGAFTYRVNYEAMVWFLSEIYPLVREQVPSVHLVITGDHANLPLPSAENITMTGYIDDIKSAIASATISLVPIRQGGGTRLKILEAMALRTPVVSTTKGAEGLELIHGKHILLADTPQDFAAAVIRLLQDRNLQEYLAENAYELVRRQYNWQAVMPRFLDLVERVAKGAPGSFGGD